MKRGVIDLLSCLSEPFTGGRGRWAGALRSHVPTGSVVDGCSDARSGVAVGAVASFHRVVCTFRHGESHLGLGCWLYDPKAV